MKYIIEIKPEYEGTTKGIIVLGIKNNCLCVDELAIEELEELNSDYINEHYGSLQDEAYQRGINDGSLDVKQRAEGAYQRGLDDAWEAARKIIRMPEGDMLDLFPECYSAVCTASQVILKYDASEAIAQLKAYEEKQNTADDIKVGDVVTIKYSKHSFVVTKVSDESVWGVDEDGNWSYWAINEVIKTDKHFDIDKILEAMRI